jgi:RES domain-containing protein
MPEGRAEQRLGRAAAKRRDRLRAILSHRLILATRPSRDSADYLEHLAQTALDLGRRGLYGEGKVGILVPSFAPGAPAADHNLVLWRWSDRPPDRVQVFDPSGRLPKEQLSWR